MKEKICSKCGFKGKMWKARPLLCKGCASKSKPNLIPCRKTLILRGRKPVNDRKTSKVYRAGKRTYKIRKQTPKSIEWGKQRVKYYLEAITDNILKNDGKVRCDNCDTVLRQIKGRLGMNVCHLISGNISHDLYLNKRNHFILGKGAFYGQCECGVIFDDKGGKEGMRIYPEYVERRQTLLREYHALSGFK